MPLASVNAPDGCHIDLSRLNCVKERSGGKIEAACPACREIGRDSTGNHLVIFSNGAFACSRFQGDKEHRSRIFQLVGERQSPARYQTMKNTYRLEKNSTPVDVKKRAYHERLITREGNDADRQKLADLRGVNVEAVQIAERRGLVAFGSCFGWASWIVKDGRGDFFQARRLDGKEWPSGSPGSKSYKAHTIGNLRSVGVNEAAPFPRVVIVEGGADILAACFFAWCEDAESKTGIVCMPGTSSRLSEDDLKALAGKPVRIFPHKDSHGAGEMAAKNWGRTLAGVGCQVHLVDVSKLPTLTGKPATDLNELAGHNGTGGIHPDYWEHSTLSKELMTF